MKITGIDILGRLPDPFLCGDGSRVTSPADWEKRRAELFAPCVDLQYGGMPPEPEFVELHPTYAAPGTKFRTYRVTTGRRAHPVSFQLLVHWPEAPKPGRK